MRKFIIVFGYLLAFMLVTVLLMVWGLAFITGGTVTVAINIFGEMYIELAMWAIVTAIMTVGLTELIHHQDD